MCVCVCVTVSAYYDWEYLVCEVRQGSLVPVWRDRHSRRAGALWRSTTMETEIQEVQKGKLSVLIDSEIYPTGLPLQTLTTTFPLQIK